MLVYGNVKRTAPASALCTAIADGLTATDRLPPGLDRHSALVGAFLSASELAQGIADLEFGLRGCDARSERGDAAAAMLLAMARAVARSWRSGFADAIMPDIAAGLALLGGEEQLSITRPEGYGLYTLYPESYLQAAQASGLGPDTIVIGIRSIGIGLAAMVAAALGAAPAISVRPFGHPFARRVEVAAELTAAIVAKPRCSFAVVDEGPGLSGSSFASVAAWLEGAGVEPQRIVFFPSHNGLPGAAASSTVRATWNDRAKFTVDFDDVLMSPENASQRLQAWIEPHVGTLIAPLEDISGGGWRKRRFSGEADWPPVDGRFERRKFLARTDNGTFLVKFAGLGDDGRRKFRNARKLADAGFAPEPVALCHGFLIERWIDDAVSGAATIERSRLVRFTGAYLGFRARSFPAPQPGASLRALAEMVICNTGEALGREASERVGTLLSEIGADEREAKPIDGDNRMHAWEWLAGSDGGLFKTDALDHSAAHDLIGCQDLAWDIAGACVEFDLSKDETQQLCASVESESGTPVELRILATMSLCYPAFQLGLWSTAAEASAGADARRARSAAERYAAILRRRLDIHG